MPREGISSRLSEANIPWQINCNFALPQGFMSGFVLVIWAPGDEKCALRLGMDITLDACPITPLGALVVVGQLPSFFLVNAGCIAQDMR